MSINVGGNKIPELTYPVLTSSSSVYIDVDFLEEYVDVLGLDSSFPAAGVDDTQKGSAVYRAQVYINSLVYQGVKTEPLVQVLQWPRSGVTDRNGVQVDSDQTPYDIFNAMAEAAYLEYNTIGILQPAIIPENLAPIREESVQAGSVSVKTAYDTSKVVDLVGGKIGADRYTRLNAYLRHWLKVQSSNFMRLART